MLSHPAEKTIAKILSFGAAFVTVFVLTSSVTDPVNVTKLFAIGGVAFAAIAAALYGGFKLIWISSKSWLIALVLFLIFSISSVINSHGPLTQNLYGSYGRNNGFILYLSLLFIALAASLLRAQSSFRLVIFGLFAAGIINVAYSLWVILFGDFIPWTNPYGNILGTFGNPNFVGAFLGIFASAVVAFAVGKEVTWKWRGLAALVFLITVYEIINSNAIQGRVVVAAGVSIIGFYLIRSYFKGWTITSLYSLGITIGAIFSLLGALQIGPLTKYIYKRSVSLRGEYWDAGWNIGSSHPLTGVGFDTYGDWYRRERNASALISPGPNTTTNTAHNVPLDIFAFGGWPLFISYLTILLLAGVALVRVTLRSRGYDAVFVTIAVAWFCYQLQSVISINQIGLAIWGWLLSGALIAYERSTRISIGNETVANQKPKNRGRQVAKSINREQIISPLFVATIGMVIGLIITLPPLSADIKWRAANISKEADQLERALAGSYLNPHTSFKYGMAADLFESSKLYDLAYKYAKLGVEFNPDSFDAWRLLYLINKSTPQEKALAAENMKRLDPKNKNPLG